MSQWDGWMGDYVYVRGYWCRVACANDALEAPVVKDDGQGRRLEDAHYILLFWVQADPVHTLLEEELGVGAAQKVAYKRAGWSSDAGPSV